MCWDNIVILILTLFFRNSSTITSIAYTQRQNKHTIHTQVIKYTNKETIKTSCTIIILLQKYENNSGSTQKFLAGIPKANSGSFKVTLASHGKVPKKVNEINKTNAEFMQYAEIKAPWLVADFFVEKAVMLTYFYFLTLQDLKFFFKPNTEATNPTAAAAACGNSG